MPNLDGTRPMGQGRMTGGGRGKCNSAFDGNNTTKRKNANRQLNAGCLKQSQSDEFNRQKKD
jgi:hypothetical protein